jgi:hypothetical protein
VELGDTTDTRKPFPPPPEEPVRFFFASSSEEEWLKNNIKQDWTKWVHGTEFVEDCARWSECKGMVFYSGTSTCQVSHCIAWMMRKFLQRDKSEALIYQLDPITHTFISRDEKWLEPPGRFVH